ncbi:hypothetical protein [Streptomyces sp. H51]|uniref:hypothetical protein n=1 Tax=Streptomyces sp. H51 TaxID=3111770 RepID=UPI002D7791DA|nr:hypothetical protein [Streptomyces sp. H51]
MSREANRATTSPAARPGIIGSVQPWSLPPRAAASAVQATAAAISAKPVYRPSAGSARSRRGPVPVRAALGATDPTASLSAADLALVRRHRFRLVSFMPETQRARAEKRYAGSPAPVTVVGDGTGALKDWFDVRACGPVVLRPDRFVAAASLTQQASRALAAVVTAGSLVREGTPA